MIELDRYAILGEVGRGPRGVVYRARDRLSNRIVALKAINPLLEGGASPALEGTWSANDALAAWRLMHPNIVIVYDAGDARGKIYIAMELLKGVSLRRELDASRPIGIGRSLRIAGQIACGLAHAHKQGVLHRNLKPSNVTVLGDDEVKITDFGIAHLGDVAILSGRYARCISYLSPEWIRGDQAIDERTDIFSLGAVLYEMLTRTSPFKGGSPVEIAAEVSQVEPPPPSELNPEISPVLDGLVLSMLAKDPDDRTSNLEMILRGLRRLEEELGERPGATGDSAGIRSATKGVWLAGRADTIERDVTQSVPKKLGTVLQQRWWIACAALVAVLAVATLLSLLRSQPSKFPGSLTVTTPIESASTTLSGPPSATGSSTSEGSLTGGPATRAPAPESPASAEETVSSRPPNSQSSGMRVTTAPATKTAPHWRMKSAKQARTETGSAPPNTATLILAVSPWGAVYVDGKYQGTTPPVTTLHVSPGTHLVEVRNASHPVYLANATVRPGEVRSIRHEFETRHDFR